MGHMSNMDQVHNIQLIAIIVSSFSLLGSLFIIGLYMSFSRLRTFPFKYVFCLSVSDIISSIGYFLVSDQLKRGHQFETDSSFTCTLQAFLINFGQLASISWTVCIAWTLFHSTVTIISAIQEKTERKIIFIAFGIPLLMSIMQIQLNYFFTGSKKCSFQFDLYGQSVGWCWIRREKEFATSEFLMVGLQFYIPLWAAFCYNGITIFRVVRYVRRITQDKQQLQLVNRLYLYPLILFICWTPGTLDRLFHFIGIQSEFLSYAHILLGGLQGFFNALVYGLNSRVKKVIRESICSKLPCFVSYNRYEEHKASDVDDIHQKKTGSNSSGLSAEVDGAMEIEQMNFH